jgi:hypothetical protein
MLLIDRASIESHLPQFDARVAHYTRIGTLTYFPWGAATWASARATPVQFLNRKEL